MISVSFLLDQLRSMKTILRVWLCRKTLSVVNTRATSIFDAILFVTSSLRACSSSNHYAPVSWLLMLSPRVCPLQHMRNIAML